MQKLKKISCLGLLALVLATIFAVSPLSVSASYAAPASSWAGHTTTWANVRTAATTSSTRVTTYAPDTNVTVYASVHGQTVNSGNSTWYRISSLSSSPRYIYSALVAQGSVTSGSPSGKGQLIVVSLSKQWLWAYNNGKQVLSTPATTGQPALPTPTGTYHIFQKLHPTIFHSPWPQGSPYYYPPTYINYAMEWRAGGFFIHDSSWRSVFGPGTNTWHYDPKSGWLSGTHGCVTAPFNAIKFLYYWTTIGTTVVIKN